MFTTQRLLLLLFHPMHRQTPRLRYVSINHKNHTQTGYKQLPSSLLAVGSKFVAIGSVHPSGTGTFTC